MENVGHTHNFFTADKRILAIDVLYEIALATQAIPPIPRRFSASWSACRTSVTFAYPAETVRRIWMPFGSARTLNVHGNGNDPYSHWNKFSSAIGFDDDFVLHRKQQLVKVEYH